MFPYFPSNPLKGLIITNFFCYLKIFPTFLIFNISFTSRNLKLEQPRIHLKKVQSHKCRKVVAPHSPKNLQILRAAHILPHLFHDLRSKKSIFFSTSFCSINMYYQNLSLCMLVMYLKNSVKSSIISAPLLVLGPWLMLWKNFWFGSLAHKSTLKKQYFIVSEPKGEVISS